MAIQYKTLDQLVKTQLDYVAANAPATLSTPLGPFITAIAYSVALVALVLQRLVQMVMQAARLSTAVDDDVDSFIADFGLQRLPATAAGGTVTFSRNAAAAASILIPVGTLVQTNATPPVQFQVVASNLVGYDASQGGYVLAPSTTSVDAVVQALTPGGASNVGIAGIAKIASALAGVDSVTNAAAFTNGLDVESDVAVRERFALYLQTLSKATKAAVIGAVDALQQGLAIVVIEPDFNNPNTSDPPLGAFKVVVDDGSGSPPGQLLSDAAGAVDLVRPIGVRAIVIGPTAVVHIVIITQIAFKTALTPSKADLQTAVRNALANYVNALPIGGTLQYGALFNAAWQSASPGDAIATTIALAPLSNTVQVFVGSTDGMAAGQLVEIAGVSTASGVLPAIKTVDSDTAITLTVPLLTAPAGGAAVKAFAISQDQIVDVHLMQVGTRNASTTTKAGASTTTKLYLNSVVGILANDYVVLADGTQTVDGAPVRVSGSPGSDFINLTAALTGVPTVGTGVVTTAGGQADVTADPTKVLKAGAGTPLDLYIGMNAV